MCKGLLPAQAVCADASCNIQNLFVVGPTTYAFYCVHVSSERANQQRQNGILPSYSDPLVKQH